MLAMPLACLSALSDLACLGIIAGLLAAFAFIAILALARAES